MVFTRNYFKNKIQKDTNNFFLFNILFATNILSSISPTCSGEGGTWPRAIRAAWAASTIAQYKCSTEFTISNLALERCNGALLNVVNIASGVGFNLPFASNTFNGSKNPPKSIRV